MTDKMHIKLFRSASVVLALMIFVTAAFNGGAYIVAADAVVDGEADAEIIVLADNLPEVPEGETDNEAEAGIESDTGTAVQTDDESEQSLQADDNRLSLNSIVEGTDTDDAYGALAVNLQDSSSAMAGNVLMSRCPSGFSDLLLSLVLLMEYDSEEWIPITQAAVLGVQADEFTLNAGDSFQLADMLKLLLIGGNDICRKSLADFCAGGEAGTVKKMNLYAKRLGTINTRVANISGAYDDRQYTNIYDIYLIMNELLKYDAFVMSFSSESADVEYYNAAGEPRELFLSRPVSAVERDIELPEGFEFVGKLTGKDDELGTNQITIAKNEKSEYCMSILMGLGDDVDINIASGNLMRTFLGEEFDLYHDEGQSIDSELGIPEEAVLPTDSNEARYEYLLGTEVVYFTTSNKPTGYETERSASRYMRSITVPVWKLSSNGNKYSSTYTIRVHKNLVESVKAIFREIYELDMKFPIKYMVGFRYRKVGGVGLVDSKFMSIHSFGAAIDINPGDYDNDYYLGAGNDLRDKTNPYCIPDEVIEIFEKYGWFWGGNFSICADTMHFQYLGLEFLQYESDEPFPILSRDGENDKEAVENLTERLVELEYLEKTTKNFNKTVEKAVIQFQTDHEIEPTGVVSYSTWEILINLTHYMSYVF